MNASIHPKNRSTAPSFLPSSDSPSMCHHDLEYFKMSSTFDIKTLGNYCPVI